MQYLFYTPCSPKRTKITYEINYIYIFLRLGLDFGKKGRICQCFFFLLNISLIYLLLEYIFRHFIQNFFCAAWKTELLKVRQRLFIWLPWQRKRIYSLKLFNFVWKRSIKHSSVPWVPEVLSEIQTFWFCWISALSRW